MMTLFTRFGNWFLLNSRNVFLIFIINYIVMIQIGYNFLGGGLWYFLTGELSESLELLNKEFSRGKYNYFWALTSSTILPVSMSFLIYIFFLFVFVIAGLTKSKRLVFDGHGSWLWVLLGSQWFLSIVYFADAIRHFLRGDEDGSFLKTVVYAACYSLIPILFSIGFWYFLGNAHRNFNSQKPSTGQDER